MNNNITQYNIAYYSQSALSTLISADILEEPHNSITYGPPTLQALSKQFIDYFISSELAQFSSTENNDSLDALITRVSSYMLNQGEIIINHNGDHSDINDLNNDFQNKISATNKKRCRN